MARLTREDVLDAGIELGDEFGLEAVTLRGVAARLAVTPMALYRHVADKDDLLDGMADLLYAELTLPDDDEDADWWDGLGGLARSTRQVLFAHPWAVPLFARPLAGPHSLRLGDALLQTLRRAGFTRAEANELHGQLTGMVFALVAPELHGKRNRAAFERGLEILHAGLEARLRQE
jgi:AcrR family transcriptional regulator